MQDRYEIGVVSQLKAPYGIFNTCNFGAATDPCFGAFLAGQGALYDQSRRDIEHVANPDPSA